MIGVLAAITNPKRERGHRAGKNRTEQNISNMMRSSETTTGHPSSGEQRQQLKRRPKNRKRQRPKPTEIMSSDSESDENSSPSFAKSKKQQNGQKVSNITTNAASKRILDKFLRKSAGADSVKEAIALHQRMMESDEDSSSTGSDFGQLWGLANLSGGDNNSNNPQFDSSTDDNESDNESESSSGSSIEILSNPWGNFSPTIGMNGRHLSGRQRRLEVARSKNSDSIQRHETSSTEGNSSEDGDMVTMLEDYDDGNIFFGQHDDSPEPNRKTLNERATGRPESNTIDARAEVPASKLQKKASTDVVARETPRSGIQDVQTASKTKAKTNGLSRPPQAEKIEAGSNLPRAEINKMATKRKVSAKSTVKKKKTKSKETGVFDNLFSNGKDFFAWAGITDPNDFLNNHKEYAEKVNSWRKDRNLPLFNDTDTYIRKLRVQVRDNMKHIKSRTATKHSNVQKGLDANQKAKKRRKKNQKIIYPSMKDLPMEGGDFMKHMGIMDIQDIFEQRDLHKHVNQWRRKQNLPLVDNERSCVANWRKWIRQNMKYRATAVNVTAKDNTPDEIDFSKCMEVVESLSKRFLNRETGLPVYQFAVYDTLSTGTWYIYTLRVRSCRRLLFVTLVG